MGWGRGRFPVISQLNAITATPEYRRSLKTFFDSHYTKANPYTLGKLCQDWDRSRYGVSPSWAEDEDNPYNGRHADDWFSHCQALPDNIRADLEEWIVRAIQNEQQIVYKFRRQKTSWTAACKNIGSEAVPIWEIVVEGQGY